MSGIEDHRGPFGVIRDEAVPMAARDGVILRADVYRPSSPGPFPALVRRTPYGNRLHDLAEEFNEAHFFASHGYIVVVQDVRGRYTSDGEWSFAEGPDGYDTIEWAASLDGSTGAVGTFGQSYGALVQYQAAALQPPHLRTCIPISGRVGTGPSNGMVELAWTLGYAIEMAEDTYRRAGRHDEYEVLRNQYVKDLDVRFSFPRLDALSDLPISVWVDRLGAAGSSLVAAIHTANKPFVERDPRSLIGRYTIPMLHIGSWYDAFAAETLNTYQGFRDHAGSDLARRNQAVVMGPWAHLLPYSLPTSGGTGDIDFGEDAAVFLLDAELEWFDHYLKGPGDGLPRPPVRIFVMGENRWRDEPAWPLTRATTQTWYLHSGGAANGLDGDGTLSTEPPSTEQADRYRYDPNHPVISAGGHFIVEGGVQDQRPNESRRDVLVYTSDVLSEDLELVGPVTMTLHASSSARDTDFFVTFVDVRPDGYAHNLLEAGVRARQRHPGEISLLEPGEISTFELDLWNACHVVFAGHRLRVHITSSDFPRFDRNASTGAPIGTDTELHPADQAVYHDSDHPSSIVVSVVPR
jgi:putative CocE/NonD family hydrolase